MLRQGPVPVFAHGVIEYLAGVFLVAAPFLFDFQSSRATAAAIVTGLVVLALTASTAMPTGMIEAVPVSVHATFDVVLAVLLVALPFVLGFRDEGAPTALFITLGVVHLLLTIATRFAPAPAPGARR